MDKFVGCYVRFSCLLTVFFFFVQSHDLTHIHIICPCYSVINTHAGIIQYSFPWSLLCRNCSYYFFWGHVLYRSCNVPACNWPCSEAIFAIQPKEVGPDYWSQGILDDCLLHNGLQDFCPLLCCLCNLASAWPLSTGCCCSFSSWLCRTACVWDAS